MASVPPEDLAERWFDADPEPWKPELGDALKGTVAELSERTSEHGSFPVVGIFDTDGKAWEWAAIGTVALGRVYELDLHPGDRLGVRYLGKTSPKSGGTPYHDWRIAVLERAARVPDASTMNAEEFSAAMARPPEPMAAPRLPGEEPF